MSIHFSIQHACMLLKYSGISFISGAVNHGFFSGQRSLVTAAIGIVLFVMGAWLEHRRPDASGHDQATGLGRTLMLGTLLSIGLGFFTGGLQHFPDSPARSAWVVPLGFFISALAMALMLRGTTGLGRSASAYVLVLGSVVSIGSVAGWQWLEQHPDWAVSGHSHGPADAAHSDAGHDATSPAATTGPVTSPMTSALVVTRSIAVQMDDQMRFTPSHIPVQMGETIRFVVHNAGRSAHEMVLGSAAEIAAHAQAMQAAAAQHGGHSSGHSHGQGAAIALEAGHSGELVVHFGQAGTVHMACLLPGHYEAGMRGDITVSPSASAPSKPGAPVPTRSAAPSDGHTGHTH